MKYGHQVALARSCIPILLTDQLLFLLERPQYTPEVREILSSSSRLSHHVVRDNTIPACSIEEQSYLLLMLFYLSPFISAVFLSSLTNNTQIAATTRKNVATAKITR